MDPTFLIMIIVLVGAMFLLNNRQRKQQRATQDLLSSLTPGQEVMMRSGMFGVVVEIDDDIVTIESEPGSRSRWLRAAIAKVVEPEAESGEEIASADVVDVEEIVVPDDLSTLTKDAIDLDKGAPSPDNESTTEAEPDRDRAGEDTK